MKADFTCKVSVTNLADFACRTGDLAPAGVVGPTAREGIRAHQRLQRAMLADGEAGNKPVESEVNLSCSLCIDKCDITVSGRVDLLDQHAHRLSEIKTTLVPSGQVPQSQRALQWAQLLLYGFLYLSDEHRSTTTDSVVLTLIHFNISAQTQESENRTLHWSELEAHARTALQRYVRWMKLVQNWQNKLRGSARDLDFPYTSFRAGQRDMAVAIYRAARDSQALMVEAPTGIGKTVSAMFPAIKLLGEAVIGQVTYLTAKVAGRASALQSLAQMQGSGLEVTAVQIRAKKLTCFCSNGRCDSDETGRCPMTLGFFDRLPAAREELLATGVITDARLDDIAWQHQLCPFELALQLLPWVHVVLADYNYVFDPLVRLTHYAESRSDTLLLVDEAHNLVDRSRAMFSAELRRSDCMEQSNTCRRQHPLVASALDKLARQLLVHAEKIDAHEEVDQDSCSAVSRAASQVVEAIADSFGQAPALPDSTGELFRTLCRFVVISDLFAEHHRCITSQTMRGRRREVHVQLFCLDAANSLARQYRLFRATVMFSATLRPGIFYRDSLGMPASTTSMQLVSPFEPAHACHYIVNWIDTRYRRRQASMPALIDLIDAVSTRKPGNYLVFFPSYAYLDLAFDAYSALHPDVEVWKQAGDQSREHRQALLAHLDQPGHRVGFAVLGGVFGEGIDYIGERLIGVVIVSPGLPGLDTQTRLVAEHHLLQGRDGFDFAYRYPGFTRVLQTVGRLVRDESDRGVVILVDDRFTQTFYRALFPDHWRIRYPSTLPELQKSVETFWASLPCMEEQAGT